MRRRKSAAEVEAELGMGRAGSGWIRVAETNGLDRIGEVASKMDQDGSRQGRERSGFEAVGPQMFEASQVAKCRVKERLTVVVHSGHWSISGVLRRIERV